MSKAASAWSGNWEQLFGRKIHYFWSLLIPLEFRISAMSAIIITHMTRNSWSQMEHSLWQLFCCDFQAQFVPKTSVQHVCFFISTWKTRNKFTLKDEYMTRWFITSMTTSVIQRIKISEGGGVAECQEWKIGTENSFCFVVVVVVHFLIRAIRLR